MKITDLFFSAIEELKKVGIKNPELEVSLMLCQTLTRTTQKEWTRATLLAHLEAPVKREASLLFQKMLRRRKERLPLAYILGEWQFLGYRFFISPAALTPRPESETIVETALTKSRIFLREKTKVRVLDIGTGAGVLALSYAKEAARLHLPSEIIGLDISKRVLRLALKNASSLGFLKKGEIFSLSAGKVRLKFLVSDLLESLPTEKFDIVMANLPYLPLKLKAALAPEVRFEPKRALFSGKDGLNLYRRLRKEVPPYLHPKSQLIFECSPLQKESLKNLFLGFNLTIIN